MVLGPAEVEEVQLTTINWTSPHPIIMGLGVGLVGLVIGVGVGVDPHLLHPLKIMACSYDNKNMNIAWHIIPVRQTPTVVVGYK